MWTPCGHVDIYPNGGLEMPGCDDTLLESIWIDGLVNGVRNFVACNHHFAVYMAIDSINSKRPDLGYLCGSWEEFVDGKCTSCGADGGGCAHYGFKAGDYALGSTRPEQTMFWMYTRENAPYGKYHHDSKIVMHQRSSDEKGTIYVNMIGMTGQSDFIEVTSGSVDLNSGETYERMTAAEHALGDILRVEFKWIYDYDWYFPWDWPIFGDPTIELDTYRF
ncbi:PREDICTED: pancreatic triacylglycerol lipase-like [Priapulus caudatus]|uniref:Pancreatic triacylglycerol lipase-like n=1 Tax=Priapulus caudatus TaxID=37621 RepID=A0ABM1EQI8_PRICU|nr:PREDICTED: pancreatic triacylglycerol lipase-like [Priapulus caudatus]